MEKLNIPEKHINTLLKHNEVNAIVDKVNELVDGATGEQTLDEIKSKKVEVPLEPVTYHEDWGDGAFYEETTEAKIVIEDGLIKYIERKYGREYYSPEEEYTWDNTTETELKLRNNNAYVNDVRLAKQSDLNNAAMKNSANSFTQQNYFLHPQGINIGTLRFTGAFQGLPTTETHRIQPSDPATYDLHFRRIIPWEVDLVWDYETGVFKFIKTPAVNNTPVATVDDVGKMFTYTAEESNYIYQFPHGLPYTPTMVLISPNNSSASLSSDDSVISGVYARIAGSNIIIENSGGVDIKEGAKWTIWVK